MFTEFKVAPLHRTPIPRERIRTLKSLRSVVQGVVYFGGGGAAFVWVINAVRSFWMAPALRPTSIEIAFGAWFLAYSSIWISQAWRFDESGTDARDYTEGVAASDVVDGVVTIVVFLRLNDDVGVMTVNEVIGYWFAVLVLALTAFVLNAEIASNPPFDRKSERLFFLSIAAWALAGTAIALNWNSIRFNGALFAVLFALTALYRRWAPKSNEG